MKSLFCLIAVLTMLTTSVSAEDTRLFELRTYHANPGKLDALQARFRDHTVKLFEKHGMTNIGYWVPKDNKDNLLIYVLAFPDEDARSESWKAFGNDPEWKAVYAESTKDGRLVGKVDSVLLHVTDYSPEIKSVTEPPARLFELRTYTTNEGKLDTLNSRFRDHTVKLFEKHGLTNVAYWTPVEEEDGRDNKLIYLLAHRDEESRNAGFKAFGEDPEWQAARKASEENGRILIEGGVQSVFLEPTDYSPMK
ncbi:MAG: NIPSNAP family protein [Planctomycetaceae bacterium]